MKAKLILESLTDRDLTLNIHRYKTRKRQMINLIAIQVTSAMNGSYVE